MNKHTKYRVSEFLSMKINVPSIVMVLMMFYMNELYCFLINMYFRVVLKYIYVYNKYIHLERRRD